MNEPTKFSLRDEDIQTRLHTAGALGGADDQDSGDGNDAGPEDYEDDN